MFWKDYGKTIRRLYINLFGAAVFGFMLSNLTTSIKDEKWSLIAYVASGFVGMIFYGYLLYLVIWEVGAKDKIRVDGGHISERAHYGIKIALVYSLPALVASSVNLTVTVLREAFGIGSAATDTVADVGAIIAYIFDLPYAGFGLALFRQLGHNNMRAAGQTLPYSVYLFACLIPGILVIWLGYYFGYRGKYMSRAYGPKKKRD